MAKVFIEEDSLRQIGDVIRERTGTSDLLSVPQGMIDGIAGITPVIEELTITENGEYQVPEGVDGFHPIYVNVPTGGGDIEVEPLVLTNDQSYGCAGPMASTYIKLFGDTVSTSGITNASFMFNNYKNETIPFEINIADNLYRDMNNMFGMASELKELPVINGAYPSSLQQLFIGCYKLRNIPDDYFDNWNFNRMQTNAYANFSGIFKNCPSLRKIPDSMLRNMWGIQTGGSYSPYNGAFYLNYVLDEIQNLPIHQGAPTSNSFDKVVEKCSRLKEFTFEVNKDGTPKTAKWKSQTIDFSVYVGYSQSALLITTYNSGITTDKQVKDDATYQALKNDPDWYSLDVNYSRYNHDSAVNTINSLPDCSATGTNTIKFKGEAGALTDGGAINTMTAEEIAVAVAKGWTVTLV